MCTLVTVLTGLEPGLGPLATGAVREDTCGVVPLTQVSGWHRACRATVCLDVPSRNRVAGAVGRSVSPAPAWRRGHPPANTRTGRGAATACWPAAAGAVRGQGGRPAASLRTAGSVHILDRCTSWIGAYIWFVTYLWFGAYSWMGASRPGASVPSVAEGIPPPPVPGAPAPGGVVSCDTAPPAPHAPRAPPRHRRVHQAL